MSRFHTQTFPCPKCQEPVEFGLAASVNADRRPDFRAAILDRSFQRGTCPNCSHSFRVEPELTYMDAGRKQWILVKAAQDVADWITLEKTALDVFDLAYGPRAGAFARELGRDLQARITFGWAALREKVLCCEHGLDDVTLEQMKLSLTAGLDSSPIGDGVELRLDKVEGDRLLMDWIQASWERPVETLEVPRALYDEIAADMEGWKDARADLTAGPFVDFQRLLIPPEPDEDGADEEQVSR
jgi:hypothetical protein